MRKLIITLIILICTTLWSSACLAKEPETSQLKLQEAIDMALKNSKSIKNSSLDIEKAKEQRENAEDSVDYAPGESQNAAADSAWYSLLSADLSWQMSKKTYAADEDSLVLDVCQKYWNIQKDIENVKIKELNISQTELALKRVRAMVNLGMTPQAGTSPALAQTNAEAALEDAKSELENANNSLNTAYETFNQVVGLWPEDRPELVEEVDFTPLKDVVLESQVNRVLAESPQVWLADKSIELAKFAYEKMYASGAYTSFEVRKIEKEQAELDAISTKDAVAEATRSLYYTVRNLEAAMPVLEKAVTGAEEALRVAKLSFDLGMVTKETVLERELALETAKNKLLGAKLDHAYAKMAFQKPWAAGSGA